MRERGTGRIFQRGSTWWIQYYHRGQQVRVSAGKMESDAKKLLKKRLAEVETNTHSDSRKISYEELREIFYNNYAIKKRKSLRRDKDGHPHLDKVARLDRFFSGFRAVEIDVDAIDKFIKEEQARGLTDATINRSVSALRRMFNLARKREKLRQIPPFELLPESKPRQGFFEKDDYDALLAALPDYLRLPFSIGYFSGMREGEILGLDWTQVDLIKGVIELREGETKNDDPRTVPIVAQLRSLLIEQRSKRQPRCPYVCFRFDRKGHAIQIRGFRKAWYSSCVKAGLGKLVPKMDRVTGEPVYLKPRGPRSKPKAKMIYQGKIFHDTRRSGVRNLINAGVPEKVAMGISGHLTRSVFDRYHIVAPKDVVEAGRKLELFLRQKVGDKTGTELHQNAAGDSLIN